MIDAITISLPGVPIGKGRPRFGNGHAFTPAKTRAYEGALQWAATAVMRGRAPLEGAISVVIDAAFPVPRSFSASARAKALAGELPPKAFDLDNVVKCALDATQSIVFGDDRLVTEIRATKRYAETPGLFITVRHAGPLFMSEAAE